MSKVPTRAGFFWAKVDHSEWFNTIVEVTGESPFFQVKIWKLTTDTVKRMNGNDIFEWGPEIIKPE